MRLGIVGLAAAIGGILGIAIMVANQSGAEPWTETFDGAPASPQAWTSPDWDIQYHTRDAPYWVAPEGMAQQHGGDCSAPPMTHPASSWPGTVYQCNNHVMTALNASGYGVIYLTPNRLADWSSGPAIVQWDMSTERLSTRDWPDLVITPWEDNQAVPLISTLSHGVDLQGPPRRAVHVGMDNGEGAPLLGITRNGSNTVYGAGWNTPALNSGIPSSVNQAATRQTFRLTLTSTSARFERLASATAPAVVFWDRTFTDIGYTSGVVQFGHHSYTPYKDGAGQPATWHWDNVTINPSIPFSMVKADRRYVTSSSQTVTLAAPAPANSYLRFAALGTVSVSLDGGPFVPATRQWEAQNRAEGASSYWHPVPAGTQSVRFQFSTRGGWYNGPYIAKDFGIWSLEGGAPSTPTTAPTATSTSTPSPTLPPTNTAIPTVTNTPVPTSTPEPTETPTATATSTPMPPTATPTATPTPANDRCRQPDRNNANTGWTNVEGRWKQDADGDWYCATSVRPF